MKKIALTDSVLAVIRALGSQGGKLAASRMTAAQRSARAKTASKVAARLRTERAQARTRQK
jgi:hypothetical protein